MKEYVEALLLLQVFSVASYCLQSLKGGRFRGIGKYLVIAALLGMAARVFAAGDGDLAGFLPTLVWVFSERWLRFIAFAGWLGAGAVHAANAEWAMSLLCLVLTAAGMVLMLLLLRALPVDFYEDALPAAETNQQALERQAKGKTERETTPKKRSKLAQRLVGSREGFTRGAGASMFFWRNLYNRRHTAPFGLLTPTCVTYLLAAFAYAAITLFLVRSRSVLPFLAGMVLVVFFRAFANPIREEMNLNYLYLVPEPSGAKLGFCLLSGLVENALNVLPAWLLLGLLLRPAFSDFALGFCLMLATDLFFSVLAIFTALVVPSGLADLVRQMVQMILFSLLIVALLGAALAGMALGGAYGALTAALLAELLLSGLLLLPCPALINAGHL